MSAATTTLILGGGIGGLATASALRATLGPEHRVVVVDRDDRHQFAASFLWLLNGTRNPAQISRPLDHLSARGIEFVHATVSAFDPVGRAVTLGDGRTLQGDFVVIALGAELDKTTPLGLAQGGHCLYEADGAVAFHHALTRLERGRVVVLTTTPVYKCPAAPYEAAMLAEAAIRKAGRQGRVEVALYAAEVGPMLTAGSEMSGALVGMLADKRIAYHPSHEVVALNPGVLHFKGGAEVAFDLLGYVPRHRAPAVIGESGLADASGWIPVDRNTFATRFPGVFAIGDVTTVPLAMGRPLPKAGVFAHGQAEVVAANLARVISGRGEDRVFDGRGACFVEVGDSRAAYGAGNFYAEPLPAVTLYRPALWFHYGKVLFEKLWLWRNP